MRQLLLTRTPLSADTGAINNIILDPLDSTEYENQDGYDVIRAHIITMVRTRGEQTINVRINKSEPSVTSNEIKAHTLTLSGWYDTSISGQNPFNELDTWIEERAMVSVDGDDREWIIDSLTENMSRADTATKMTDFTMRLTRNRKT